MQEVGGNAYSWPLHFHQGPSLSAVFSTTEDTTDIPWPAEMRQTLQGSLLDEVMTSQVTQATEHEMSRLVIA